MTIATTFASRESMDQLIEMDMEHGLAEALGQIDALPVASAFRREVKMRELPRGEHPVVVAVQRPAVAIGDP